MRASKKIISFLLAAFVLLGSLCLSSCGSDAPALEDVYDRLVYVIEESMVVNTVIFGEGLPVYEPESDLAELKNLYYGFNKYGVEYVMPYARYGNTEEIRAAMARVYSKAYRDSLEEMLFTGYAYSELQDAVIPAKYTEDMYGFYQSEDTATLVGGMRFYDYASMKLLDSSNAQYLKVSIRSYSDKTPNQWEDRELTFVYENDNWYLDVPSC